jgi:uncharacterized protein YlxP (DUF503 family)
MITRTAQITFYVPVCHSLKDKRMIVRSILKKVKNKFNVSIAEVDAQDAHQTIVIGLAMVSSSNNHAQNALDEVIRFIENNADAEITGVEFYGV